MQFPTLTEQGQSREMISTFAGYDHNRSIAANAFYDMKNMSSDGYPLLQSRARRGVVRQMETPQGFWPRTLWRGRTAGSSTTTGRRLWA